jgi:hypothetical protein
MVNILKEEIIQLIEREGPFTGAEILAATGGDALILWRTCRSTPRVLIRTVGSRYLRLDRRITGYSRLSPSILREFLTYSVVGAPKDAVSITLRANDITSHTEKISRQKWDLASSMVSSLSSQFENEFPILEHITFILAGDIAYGMAHDVLRPERSTGKLVRGSDLDIVIIVDEHCPDWLVKRLDETMYQEKWRILVTPHLKEEIDYVVKDMDRIQEQLRFDTFKRMVACKILYEGRHLQGNKDMFSTIKGLLREHGIEQRLIEMEERARAFRMRAETFLLEEDPREVKEKYLDLFYPSEESEEFE